MQLKSLECTSQQLPSFIRLPTQSLPRTLSAMCKIARIKGSNVSRILITCSNSKIRGRCFKMDLAKNGYINTTVFSIVNDNVSLAGTNTVESLKIRGGMNLFFTSN